ncbi:MAG: helix-turn-helix domain-containing protein [FCB group bacterium]
MAQEIVEFKVNSHTYYIPQKLENIVSDLSNNFSDCNINIKQLCLKHDISYTHLYEEFLTYLKITPSTFLDYLRLKFFISLIDEKEISIFELSSKAGFKHPRTFRNVFRRHMGICPCQCRDYIIQNNDKETQLKKLTQKIFC